MTKCKHFKRSEKSHLLLHLRADLQLRVEPLRSKRSRQCFHNTLCDRCFVYRRGQMYRLTSHIRKHDLDQWFPTFRSLIVEEVFRQFTLVKVATQSCKNTAILLQYESISSNMYFKYQKYSYTFPRYIQLQIINNALTCKS